MTEVSAGGIVFRPDGKVLLIKDAYGRWTLPKGHVEAGETREEAAVREIREETGITARIDAYLATITYPLPSKPGVRKDVHFFRLSYVSGQPRPQEEEIRTAAFFPLMEAEALLERNSYPGQAQLLRQAAEGPEESTGIR